MNTDGDAFELGDYAPTGQTLLTARVFGPGAVPGATVVPYSGHFTETGDRPHLQQAVLITDLAVGESVGYEVEARGSVDEVGATIIAAQGAADDVCVSYTTFTVRSLTDPTGSWLRAQVSTTTRVPPPAANSGTAWALEELDSAGTDLSVSSNAVVSAAGDSVIAILDLQVELWFG